MREQGLLTAHECDLYLYLVHRCNRLGWSNPFGQPSDITCAVLGINRNALVIRRNRLKRLGFIRSKEGERKTEPPLYALCNPNDTQNTTLRMLQADTLATPPPVTSTNTINKNNTKHNKTLYENKREVDYQFVISSFNEICKSLPKIARLIEGRKLKIDAIVLHIGIDKLVECFKLVEESYFLSKRKSKWKATFDWIVEPENTVKILEGSYSAENESSVPDFLIGHHKTNIEQYGG